MKSNEIIAKEISAILIKNQYALQINMDFINAFYKDSEMKMIRLFFTKALLYDEIENVIKMAHFLDDMVICATPIRQVNKEFGDQLRKKIKSYLDEIVIFIFETLYVKKIKKKIYSVNY